MALRFSRHARHRMRRDGVSEEDVRDCIDLADDKSASIRGRTNYIKYRGASLLRVTAIEEGATGYRYRDASAQKAAPEMKITYDPEADALYIALRSVAAVDSVDVEDGVVADLDDKGHIIGLEVLDASKRLTPEELCQVSYENLVSKKGVALRLP